MSDTVYPSGPTGPHRDRTAPGLTRARTWTVTRARASGDAAGRGLVPGRDALVDAAFTVVLVGLALLGFRTDFAGYAWVLAAAGGLLVGLLLAHVTTALRLPAVATLAGVVVAYFLLGGPLAVRGDLVGGVVPSLRTFADLARTAVQGWKRLVTLLPPVDTTAELHALPWAVGLVGGAVTYAVARRLRSPYAVVLAPLAVLGLVIVLGTLEPAALAAQGVGFAVVAVGWMVERSARTRAPLQNGAGRATRLGVGTGLVALAAVAGLVVGPHLPGGDANPRLVARAHVTPPIDIAAFASPLAGFRKYTEPNKSDLYNTTVLDVRGLPAGTPLRFATLDSYDGSVWGAASRANTGSVVPGASFQQVGRTVAAQGPGRPTTVTVTVPDGGYSDVWLPTAGTVTGFRFTGARQEALASQLWLNVDTDTALVPARLEPGDTYTFTAYVPATATRMPQSLATSTGSLTESTDTSFLDAKLDAWTGEVPDAWAQFRSVARVMQSEGAYTDGGTENSVERFYLPGHSIGRLARFTSIPQLAGDDEQYAATLALVGNRLGIPTRVVMGAIVPASGQVQGKDVHAWVEVRDATGTWVPVLQDNFLPDRDRKPKELQTKVQDRKVGAIVPPPPGSNPPSVLQGPDQAQNATNLKKPPKKLLDPTSWPWWLRVLVLYVLLPLLALTLLYWLVRGLKAWRRKRHATRGPTPARIAWAWNDLVASARSYGHHPPRRATRLEQAGAVRGPVDLRPLAVSANALVFGPGLPSDADAAAYWAATNDARSDLRANADFWRRLRSDVDLRPLFAKGPARPPRARKTPPRGPADPGAPSRAADREPQPA
ncbi:transglutaminaseTgpA domain-containing protein [Pedococcus sp. NPDC057267]|uniref:transglutaminaseTgpA domain-containing protein n=1 Tax=Pedococcus sp. NPDC057267 TaxID=3346077 RepID=UPI00362E0018